MKWLQNHILLLILRVKICKTIRSALNSVPRFLLRVLVRTEMTNLYIYIIYIYIYMHYARPLVFLVWALWHGLGDPTCVRSLGVAILPYLHPSISTALMRPRRPKQYCLQLVIYIYIYIYMLIVIFYDLPFSRDSFNIKKLSNSFRSWPLWPPTSITPFLHGKSGIADLVTWSSVFLSIVLKPYHTNAFYLKGVSF